MKLFKRSSDLIVKQTIYLLPLLLLTLLACSAEATDEDVIGGTWTATAGYEDGEPVGEPYCIDFMMEGLEFKEEGIVYSALFDEEYEYYLEDREEGMTVVVKRKDIHYTYYIDKLGDDEIGLRRTTDSEESCYLERK